jgi:hypothetical protein
LTRIISCGRGLQLAASTFKQLESDEIELVHYLGSDFELLPVYFSLGGSYPLEIEGLVPNMSKVGARLSDVSYCVKSVISSKFGGLDIQSSISIVVPTTERGRLSLDTLQDGFGGLSLPFLDLKVSEVLRSIFSEVSDLELFWSTLNDYQKKE